MQLIVEVLAWRLDIT